MDCTEMKPTKIMTNFLDKIATFKAKYDLGLISPLEEQFMLPI